MVDCLVIGSGLVAHELSELWSDADGDLLIADMSGLAQTKVVSEGAVVFDEKLISATAKVGGGSSVWGGKVTIPTEENWFAPRSKNIESSSWLEFGDFVSKSITGNLETEFLRQVNRGLSHFSIDRQSLFKKSGMSPDRHVFLPDKKRYDSKVANFGMRSSRVSAIIEFDVQKSGGNLVFEDQTGAIRDVNFRKLVLASGPIGNAMILSMLTAPNLFPIGNHAHGIVGRVRLDRVMKFGQDAYLHHGKSFFSGSSLINERGRGDHSVRLVPDSSRANSLASLQFGSEAFLKDLLHLIYLRAGFTNSFEIFAMAELEPSGELKISASQKGGKVDSMSLTLRPKVNSTEIFEELKILAQRLNSLPHVIKLSLKEPKELQDSAHYFGTIPMRDEPQGNEVSSFFKLEGLNNTWSLGASGFPAGSHGHPTLLSVLTAHRAIDSIRAA
tara:strand:- start:218 stop:1546 length:1329 start_codon:yes stop_codon:yes gene_type:complete